MRAKRCDHCPAGLRAPVYSRLLGARHRCRRVVSCRERVGTDWSRRAGSNRRPAAYKAAALPAELRRPADSLPQARTGAGTSRGYTWSMDVTQPYTAPARDSRIAAACRSCSLSRRRRSGRARAPRRRRPPRSRSRRRKRRGTGGARRPGAQRHPHRPAHRRGPLVQERGPAAGAGVVHQDHDGAARARALQRPRAAYVRAPGQRAGPARQVAIGLRPGDRITVRRRCARSWSRAPTTPRVTLATAVGGSEAGFVAR